MIMPGDVIFHEGTATRVVASRHFVVLVVAVTSDAVDSVCLFQRGRYITRSMHSVVGWLTCGMGYTLIRNGQPVTIVTNVV
jgi:hypothetical protein